MKTIRAKHYWFCFWVEKAHKTVEEELKKNWKAQVWWELIHNKPALDKLRKKWMAITENVDEIKWNLIIRSHWISDKKRNKIKLKAEKIIDATCPYVVNVHIWAKKFLKEWRKIVVIWDANHPEMRGLTEDLEEFYCIIKEEDVDFLNPNLWKIWIIAQTTLKKETYDRLLNKLKEKYKDIKEKNTICNATTERQNAVKELSEKSDIIIVIWWKNSNNTKKLWELANEKSKSYKVETKEELKKEWFLWKEIVWITAWASTPEWLIEEIEGEIKKIS